MSLLNRANNLAFYELLGDAAMMNKEFENYRGITTADLIAAAKDILRPEACNTLYYRKQISSAEETVG
jgi:predicted Zn-dependent peptidase